MEEEVHMWAGAEQPLSTERLCSSDLFMQRVCLCYCTTVLSGWEFDVMPTKYSDTHLNQWSISTHIAFLQLHTCVDAAVKPVSKVQTSFLSGKSHGRPVYIWDNNLDTGWLTSYRFSEPHLSDFLHIILCYRMIYRCTFCYFFGLSHLRSTQDSQSF